MSIKINKNIVFIALLSLLSIINLFAQKENYISIVVPEEEVTTTTYSRYRLAANTLPGSSVSINGENIKVYPSGAFVDLLKLDFGKNEFKIKSTKNGITVNKQFTITREDKSLKTTSTSELIIEDELMLPEDDLWLDAGDVLEVRVKGTPGCKAYFMDGIEMTELPASENNGVEGIYTGIFIVRDNTNYDNLPITFKLEQDGESVEKKSKAKVSLIPNKLPRVAVTKGDRPYLNYGLGDDRLGGAKLSFMEAGIKLTINGMSGDQYRVKLTDNYEAWIPKDQVDLLPFGTYPPKSLTDSWAAYGGKKSDKIIIRMNEKLPYSTRQEVDPTRIIVDVYGATSNSNWITQHINTEGIKNLYYEQAEKDLFRIIIEPTRKQIWGYKIGYSGNSLEIEVKRQPENLSFKNLSFVLDAGHGGSNNGSLGSTGLLEKDVTLDIVKRLETMLRGQGAKVTTTRSEDVYSKNSERLQNINSSNADILISIHANSIGYTSDPVKVSGTSTYYKHIAYRPLSVAIYQRMLELGLEQFGNVGNFNFALNSPTEILNVLVETAFMSNPNDEMKLMNAEFKDKICRQIIQGVQDFLYACEDNSN
ncbi:MAG: N-acetylmuramoyl-L-alanine amidase [Ignavibacteriales bacterium]|nr:N-acetylmuramoyl-L-alanine amidase [Ignavibacteriales bacterium]